MATGWRGAGLGWPDWRFRGVGRPAEVAPVGRLYPDCFRYAAKIYATAGLNYDDASWIAKRAALLVADASIDIIATALKSANRDMLLVRYVTTPLVWEGSNTYKGTVPEGDIPSEHPDWIWMWNPPVGDPERIWNTPSRYYILPNSGSGAWPAYWVEQVLEFIGALPFDGVHGDIAVFSLLKFQDQDKDKLAQHYGGDDELFLADQEPYITALRNGLNAAGLFAIFNNFGITNPYFLNTRLNNIDGFNHQYIFMTLSGDAPVYQAATIAEGLMDIIDKCKAAGKICMLASAPVTNDPQEWDMHKIKYCLYAHMLVAQIPHTYFNIDPPSGGNWQLMQALFNDFGEAFQTDFGQPLGERYKEGGIWKREFVNGLLQVDLVNHTYAFDVAEAWVPSILRTGEGLVGVPGRATAEFGGLPEVEPREVLTMLDVTEPVRETQVVRADVDGNVRGRTRSIEAIRSRMPHGNRKVVNLPRGTELASKLDYAVKVQAIGGSTGATYTPRHLGGGKIMIESSVVDDTAEIEVTVEERTRERG